jgi:hypothetical protein
MAGHPRFFPWQADRVIMRLIEAAMDRRYGPLSAAPNSTGCSDVVLQRQPPLSAFWKANVFSTLTRCPTDRLSLLPGVGFGLPALRSQQVPVQLDATALQAANGDSTIISTSAVTSAFCSATSLSILKTRLTVRKSPQALAEWI